MEPPLSGVTGDARGASWAMRKCSAMGCLPPPLPEGLDFGKRPRDESRGRARLHFPAEVAQEVEELAEPQRAAERLPVRWRRSPAREPGQVLREDLPPVPLLPAV